MKKNKFLLVSMILLGIALVQPQNFNGLKSALTQHDITSQLNISDSPEEKNWGQRSSQSKQNDELRLLDYDGTNQVIVVNEQAQFSEQELSLSDGSWESYSDLDWLNRVGVAEAMMSQDLMPTEERESIASVHPTGWKNQKIMFNGQEDYLYNRSHLIGFQLSGENANVRNLFTGTRALNANFEDEQSSMVYYENMVANYIKETNHHVRYRVTPLFRNVELVARGVRIEAQSIEDDTISFDVYIHNIQPGYDINYLTGQLQKIEKETR